MKPLLKVIVRSFFAGFVTCLLILPTGDVRLFAQSPAMTESGCTPIYNAKTLSRMNCEQLDQIFANGKVGALPVGLGRGKVLLRTDTKLPRLRAKLASVVWKGKYFQEDGDFTNQWIGFRAIESHMIVGESWYDAKPCIVLEYPEGTKVFGNARDELREIAPGILLGRFYERCPCPKTQGYFVLELESCPKQCP